MRVVRSAAELASGIQGTGRTAVVMTMGALHEGHVELMRAARSAGDGPLVATIFVNPSQFGPGEDFHRYPRTPDADLDACRSAGVDLVFTPSVEEVYGSTDGMAADAITVDPGPLGDILEGASRPGHFRGVLTVVHKLLGLTRAEVAFFGEKDYQQLVLISRMVGDLNLPVRVEGVPTVREPDGLARSSRNRYLSAEERIVATSVPRALEALVAALDDGVDPALAAGRAVVAATEGMELDYLEVVAPDLSVAPEAGPARALIAARVGTTRLIDNLPCWVGPQ